MLEEENRLLARARAFSEFPALPHLTLEQCGELTRRYGVDFATALLYDRVKGSLRHASFIEQIDQLQQHPSQNKTAHQTMIGIVPASFYKEKPHSGADGRVIAAAATAMGFPYELIPLQSTGTLAENSRILLDWLARHRSRQTIVVSLCKGSADVKVALSAPEADSRFESVLAWINICGTLSGSPFAQWLLATRPGFFAAWLFCKCGGHNFRFLQEIVPSAFGSLSSPLRLPPRLPLINIVGFPLRRHLSNSFMRRCHKFISRQGPNDGGVLLADVCQLPGLLYPVWGADHYLRPDARAGRIIRAVLEYVMNGPLQPATAHSPEELCSATETPGIDQIARTSLA